jgi:hypothetical protein
MLKETIHENNELAHGSDEGDQRLLAHGTEVQIEGLKNGVMANGAEGRHVKSRTDQAAPAADTTGSPHGAAVLVIGSESGQGCSGPIGNPPQLRQLGQNRGGDHGSDPWDGIKALRAMSQEGVGRHQGGNGAIALQNPFLEGIKEALGLTQAKRISVVLRAVAFHRLGLDQLAAAAGEIDQALLVGGKGRRRRRVESRAITGQHLGIDGISLGAKPLGSGEVANPGSLQDTQRDRGGMKSADHRAFITACSLANDVGRRMSPQELEELDMALGIVAEGMGSAGKMELQGRLGNIEAGMDNGGINLTHTYGYEPRRGLRPPCSSNGSS